MGGRTSQPGALFLRFRGDKTTSLCFILSSIFHFWKIQKFLSSAGINFEVLLLLLLLLHHKVIFLLRLHHLRLETFMYQF
jgi:hypothetical protein